MRFLSADAFIVATGSVPALPPVPGFDLPGILTSDGVLGLEMLPKSILLVGGGVIGIEFASIFSALGVEVTVVEMLPEILPNLDVELVGYLRQILEARGIRFLTSATVKSVRALGSGYATAVTAGVEEEIVTEKVFVCMGRCPFTQGLGLEEIGVRTDRGQIAAVRTRGRTATSSAFSSTRWRTAPTPRRTWRRWASSASPTWSGSTPGTTRCPPWPTAGRSGSRCTSCTWS